MIYKTKLLGGNNLFAYFSHTKVEGEFSYNQLFSIFQVRLSAISKLVSEFPFGLLTQNQKV